MTITVYDERISPKTPFEKALEDFFGRENFKVIKKSEITGSINLDTRTSIKLLKEVIYDCKVNYFLPLSKKYLKIWVYIPKHVDSLEVSLELIEEQFKNLDERLDVKEIYIHITETHNI